jgi:hypothetical protein
LLILVDSTEVEAWRLPDEIYIRKQHERA